MKKNHFALLMLCILLFSNPAFSGKLYKWVDENGEVSFSDKVPPKDSRREREELNELGRTIAIKDAAKTPEQIQQLKRIVALQKTKQLLLETQLKQDGALLRTFQSTDDIDALAESKSKTIDSHITIAIKQSAALKKQLLVQQKSAAQFERSGKNIPAKTAANIKSAQAQYNRNQLDISDFKLQKEQLAIQQTSDKKRLTVLKSSSKKPTLDDDSIPSLMLGELGCDTGHCKKLWQEASNFISQKNTNVIFTSDMLILTKKPTLSKDRSLSLTKIIGSEKTNIVLDIRCANSKGGKTTCNNKKTAQLVSEFNALKP